MKKITAGFILSIIMILNLCACGSKGDAKCKPNLDKPFCVNAEINYDGLVSEAKFQRNGEADWNVEFSSPNTLAGVILSFKDANVEASYKGLSFSVPKSTLPLKSIISTFIEVADTMAKQPEIIGNEKDNLITSEGEAELGKYEITFDKNGCIAGFAMPSLNLTITFTECAMDATGVSEAVTEVASECVETEVTDAENEVTVNETEISEN